MPESHGKKRNSILREIVKDFLTGNYFGKSEAEKKAEKVWQGDSSGRIQAKLAKANTVMAIAK